jgi:hypothetical protein
MRGRRHTGRRCSPTGNLTRSVFFWLSPPLPLHLSTQVCFGGSGGGGSAFLLASSQPGHTLCPKLRVDAAQWRTSRENVARSSHILTNSSRSTKLGCGEEGWGLVVRSSRPREWRRHEFQLTGSMCCACLQEIGLKEARRHIIQSAGDGNGIWGASKAPKAAGDSSW